MKNSKIIIPWNKGKTGVYSEKTLEKMRNAKIGKMPWNKGLKGIQTWHNIKGLIKVKKGNTLGFKKGHKRNIGINNGMFGKKPWNYIDGRSKLKSPDRYGDDWSKIRLLIYERDNWECKKCGLKMSGRTGAHHVHHIIPFLESFDNSLGNLITLCPSCHCKIECEYLKRAKGRALRDFLNIGQAMAEELKN